MPTKGVVVASSIGLFAASAAFVGGMIVGASNAQVSLKQDQPNQNCFPDSSSDTSETHRATKLVACQVVGMTEAEGIALIEKAGIAHRIASRDGEGFALTEDYSESRINLDILVGIITGASAW